jgi:hypothetical protein
VLAAALLLIGLCLPQHPQTTLAAVEQTDLSFTGLLRPNAVAVAPNGNVYVADAMNARIVKLVAA